VLDTSKGFTDEVSSIIFDYIWKYKNPKLKKTTIIKNKKEGGLKSVSMRKPGRTRQEVIQLKSPISLKFGTNVGFGE